MTLLMYGVSRAGSIYALADGRTTKGSEIASDQTVKLHPFPGTDGTKSGDFAAVVLISGRSDFALPGSGVTGQQPVVDAMSAVTEYLALRRDFTSVGQLGDAIWSDVIHPLWWHCRDCCDQKLVDAAFWGQDFDGESCCDTHVPFSLTVVGFDGGTDDSPRLYMRTFAEGPAVEEVMAPGSVYFSDGDRPPTIGLDELDDRRVRAEFQTRARLINASAREVFRQIDDQERQDADREALLRTDAVHRSVGSQAADSAAELESIRRTHQAKLQDIESRTVAGTVGGRVLSCVVDSQRGIKFLPDWVLSAD
ncbi:hypothetical protein [Rhodococcus sp. IEGM1428]|uniref:hypothetical protein n=1 Tax=Rhodococcus sp. IEGM1428 TaxID=3392191 RepID=UPI003D0EAEA5